MDRSTSTDKYGYGAAFPRPPWERRDIPQVPYLGPTSPKPSPGELSGFSSPRPHRPTAHRSNMSTDSVKSTPSPPPYFSPSLSPEWSDSRRPSNPQQYQYQQQQRQQQRQDQRQDHRYLDRPSYHEPTYNSSSAAPTPRAIPPQSSFIPDRAPPTPPESIASAKPSPPGYPHAPMALPGTMSSRERTPSQTPAVKSERRAVRQPNHAAEPDTPPDSNKPKQEPLGKRFKSVFRDMFKREPVDESQFEHISDRHWTDDY